MQALLQAARERHVREIRGHVMANNPGMLRFAESIGLTVMPSDDPMIRRLMLRL
jgi:hypothetical protein